jgi:hypothetical protein
VRIKELDLLDHDKGENPAVRPPRDGGGYDQASIGVLVPSTIYFSGICRKSSTSCISSLADRIDDLLDVMLGHAE